MVEKNKSAKATTAIDITLTVNDDATEGGGMMVLSLYQHRGLQTQI